MKNLFRSMSFTLIVSLSAFPTSSFAKIEMKTIEYKDQGVILEGVLAFDTRFKGKRPGILLVHEWTGIGSYVRMRLQKLAELGYVAFAADIYGKGVRPSNPKDAATTAGIYKSNRPLLRERANQGLQELLKQPNLDQKNVAAMGYCFGGTTILELARSGANVKGFLSFHGGLETPTPQDAKNIKGEVIAFHGADDPYVPLKEVDAFQKEMKDAQVKLKLIQYKGAVQGFTNPENGTDNSKGAAYNKEADQRSWKEMKLFLARIFK
jgi:dienelactone hydrolase